MKAVQRWFPSALLMLLMVGMPLGLAAQSGQAGPGQELTREEMQARIHAHFEEQLSRELGLDAETRAEVYEVLQSMRSERRALLQRKRALHARRKQFHQEGGSQREARRILAEAREIRSMEARIESEEEARLLEIMSPRQVLQFQVLREELNERIRQMHRGDSLRLSGPFSRDRRMSMASGTSPLLTILPKDRPHPGPF